MTSTHLGNALVAAAGALEAQAGELNRLDGFAGDGDMGITMTEVATVVKQTVLSDAPLDPAQLLTSCGAAIARSAPSTSGTLMATGFLRAAKVLASEQEGSTTDTLERCFRAALEGIQARGKASVGDRTMVDALDAICTSLEESASEGRDWREALSLASGAAAQAAAASATMKPQVGRASWVPERALGHPDAGCTMLALTLAAACAALKDH